MASSDDILNAFTRLKSCQEQYTAKMLISLQITESHLLDIENNVKSEGIKALRPGLQTFLKLDSQKSIATLQKNYHAHISRFLKILERACVQFPIYEQVNDVNSEEYILQLVYHYLYWNGYTETIQELNSSKEEREDKYDVSEREIDHVQEIAPVIKATVSGDMSVAEAWVSSRSEALGDAASDISFDIARLKLLTLFNDNEHILAPTTVSAIQTVLPHYYSKYRVPVERIMGFYLWRRASVHRNSALPCPYPELMSHATAVNCLCQKLLMHCAQLHDLPTSPHLLVALDAGAALVPLLQTSLAYEQDHRRTWSALEQIPIDPPATLSSAGKKDKQAATAAAHAPALYHSVFSCPVSHETASASNPPVLLKCGHAVCRQSMAALPRVRGQKFKCPTCYSEMTAQDALELHF